MRQGSGVSKVTSSPAQEDIPPPETKLPKRRVIPFPRLDSQSGGSVGGSVGGCCRRKPQPILGCGKTPPGVSLRSQCRWFPVGNALGAHGHRCSGLVPVRVLQHLGQGMGFLQEERGSASCFRSLLQLGNSGGDSEAESLLERPQAGAGAQQQQVELHADPTRSSVKQSCSGKSCSVFAYDINYQSKVSGAGNSHQIKPDCEKLYKWKRVKRFSRRLVLIVEEKARRAFQLHLY